ncbi:MAG: ABC transporter ATP-binding protein [Alphaproteobacteria bacterium]|nr:ABC transporter ATP-binding protein [Alphaproteobacteria bacterium]
MRDVVFTWPGRPRFTMSIDEFTVERGERLLLIGPSGGGKSTLLSLLAGIVTPDDGSVEILGTNLSQLSPAARDQFRAEHFGIIFQMFNLLPYGTVIDNVLLPLSFSKSRRDNVERNSSAAGQAARLLASLGLQPEQIAKHRASSLSVGQQQRVAAARALIGGPELIVADEPTSSLDRISQQEFLELLFNDAGKAGSTLIMVSHDETLASDFTRVVHLDDIAKTEREQS